MKLKIGLGLLSILAFAIALIWSMGDSPVTPTPTPVVTGTPTPQPPAQSINGDVTYHGTIDTDSKKLAAMESLIGQTMAAARTESGKALSKEQQNELSTIMKRKLKVLFEERGKLREDIFRAAYPDLKVWNALTDEEQFSVYDTMYGDKAALRELPTLATSKALNELKAVDATKLSGVPFSDPIEDFTTYTEVDEGTNIDVTSDTITFTAMDGNETSYVYKDMTASHFAGNYEHLFKITIGATTGTSSQKGHWALANYIGLGSVGDAHVMFQFGASEGHFLRERSGGSNYNDEYAGGTGTFYNTVERDEAVGANGTIYAYIYDAVTREPGDLLDTLTLTLHENEDWQYVYGLQNYNNGAGNLGTGTTEDLDLQEDQGQIF